MSSANTNQGFSKIASNEEIESAKTALEARGFTLKVVNTIEEAKTTVLGIVPENTEVFTASSVTLDESGLTAELNSDKYKSVRDEFMPLYGQKGKEIEMRRIGSGSDYTVGSVHAVTQEGDVMIASATGSQLPNYAYGANHVIWVVGAQKIVKDLNQAFERLETYTFPLEDERAKKVYGSGSSINKILIYRKDPNHRITIVLVKEPIGF
jgi:hypothetical protein